MRHDSFADIAGSIALDRQPMPAGELSAAIDREAARLLGDRQSMTAGSTLLGLLLIVSISIQIGQIWALLPILGIRILSTGANLYLLTRLKTVVEKGRAYKRELDRLAIGMFVGGAVWPLMLLPSITTILFEPLAIVILLSVLCAGGIVTLSSCLAPKIMYAYMAGYTGAFLALMAFHWSEYGLIPALALVAFVCLMLVYGNKLFRQTRESIKVQIEYAALARNMVEVNELLNESLLAAQKLSAEDSLTGLDNRRSFEERLAKLRNRTIGLPGSESDAIAILLLDLDNFKAINDRHGHLLGDAVLEAVAQAIRSQVGGGALCGRWGGEEFIVALPTCNLDEVQVRAEKLRHAIEALVGTDWPDEMELTTSIGIAWWQVNEMLENAVARADRALYRAKHDGRNCVRCAELSVDSAS